MTTSCPSCVIRSCSPTRIRASIAWSPSAGSLRAPPAAVIENASRCSTNPVGGYDLVIPFQQNVDKAVLVGSRAIVARASVADHRDGEAIGEGPLPARQVGEQVRAWSARWTHERKQDWQTAGSQLGERDAVSG